MGEDMQSRRNGPGPRRPIPARADGGDDESATTDLETSGHVERTILHRLCGDGTDRFRPSTVSDVLDDVAAVIDRGDYGNVGMRNEAPTVRKSSVRRTFTQLADKGLVTRVGELDAERLRDDRYDLGELDDDADPADPGAYARTSDDARVTDWVLTPEGREEVRRLDAAYERELDALAARYGRQRGETTDRIEA